MSYSEILHNIVADNRSLCSSTHFVGFRNFSATTRQQLIVELFEKEEAKVIESVIPNLFKCIHDRHFDITIDDLVTDACAKLINKDIEKILERQGILKIKNSWHTLKTIIKNHLSAFLSLLIKKRPKTFEEELEEMREKEIINQIKSSLIMQGLDFSYGNMSQQQQGELWHYYKNKHKTGDIKFNDFIAWINKF